MKKVNSLKINLIDRDMNMLKGGLDPDCCGCGCNGPSSTDDNMSANSGYGYGQSAGGNKVCISWVDENGNNKFDPDEWDYASTC